MGDELEAEISTVGVLGRTSRHGNGAKSNFLTCNKGKNGNTAQVKDAQQLGNIYTTSSQAEVEN